MKKLLKRIADSLESIAESLKTISVNLPNQTELRDVFVKAQRDIREDITRERIPRI